MVGDDDRSGFHRNRVGLNSLPLQRILPANGGIPLFNQTDLITPQMQALGVRLNTFAAHAAFTIRRIA
jgi:hypothetical protein